MSKLPVLSGNDLCALLSRIGYHLDHQTGGHIILRCENYPFRRLTIPNHKEIAKGTLRNIIRDCGLTIDEFNKLVSK